MADNLRGGREADSHEPKTTNVRIVRKGIKRRFAFVRAEFTADAASRQHVMLSR